MPLKLPVLPQQLEASLKKSATLLQLTEKDRDEWKATAMKLTKEMERNKAALVDATDRLNWYRRKVEILSHNLREMAEQLEA